MILKIVLSEKAKKQLLKVPERIADKFFIWVKTIDKIGLENTRKIPGYHDEPLHGKRKAQRSIRLSLHYRAIYELKKEGAFQLLNIEQVTKHAY